jgi:hypothetical protein
MKTAMQELFEYWDTQNNPLVILNWIASNEKRLLEKEKEQSIELIKQTAMFMAAANLDSEIAKMSYEDVYNSYYNQNK